MKTDSLYPAGVGGWLFDHHTLVRVGLLLFALPLLLFGGHVASNVIKWTTFFVGVPMLALAQLDCDIWHRIFRIKPSYKTEAPSSAIPTMPASETAGVVPTLAPGSASDLLRPFFTAKTYPDLGSMADAVKSKLCEVAERLGYRDGKEGASIPPAEWCDGEPMQEALRLAWVRGCERGMLFRQNTEPLQRGK